MDAWVRGVEAAMATDRRALCASAALQRAESPPVNLAGLDSAQAVRRRAACLNAALARFVAAPGPTAAAAAAELNTPPLNSSHLPQLDRQSKFWSQRTGTQDFRNFSWVQFR